jgi:hypothetical protein
VDNLSRFDPSSTETSRCEIQKNAKVGLTPPLTPGGSGGTGSVLARIAIFGETSRMSAAEIIEQIKALPPNERAEVAKFVAENDDSWIPESFKRGMADAEAGRFVDMETVLSGAKPPPRRTE